MRISLIAGWLLASCGVAASSEATPLGLASEAAPAHAASSPPVLAPLPPGDPVFTVAGFALDGVDPLPPGRAQSVLAPFTGPGANLARLRAAVAALEAELRLQGFGLYRVSLPPQALDGPVLLTLTPQRLGQLSVSGARHAGDAQILRMLPALRVGEVPLLHPLAAQTTQANENPARQVQVVLREAEGPASDRVNARVLVRDERPWTLAASLSNHGSVATGRDRFTLSGRHANLGDHDLEVQGAYTTSLAHPQNVKQAGALLRLPLPAVAGHLAALYSRSDVVGDFGGFTSTGAGRVAGLSFARYLPLGGEARHQVGLGWQDKLFEAARIDGVVLPGLLDRRSQPWSLSYRGRWERTPGERASAEGEAGQAVPSGQAWNAWNWAAEWASNTGRGRGNDLAAYQSEDPRISVVRWHALRLSMAMTADLPAGSEQAPSAGHSGHAGHPGHSASAAKPAIGSGWRLAGRAQAQWASTALIAGEQFGLGGLGTVRGTHEERPLAGDNGWQGTMELSRPVHASWRMAGFVDAGGVSRKGAGDAGRPVHDSLVSAGLGLRWAQPGASLVIDWGRIIQGSRTPLAVLPTAPQRGDARLYLALSVSF